ncbi:MAG TPA: hypothetical protein VNR66_03605 [Solirubrobacteraceae bacterium]|nr:hypothetical protein [Solirubrobacteraceae bacterium]
MRARATDAVRARATDPVRAVPPPRAYSDERVVAERRTVTIRGQVADRHRSPVGQGPARRRPPRSVHERAGSNPDRIAMWAVLLGVILVLAAATSSHAAVIKRVTVPATAQSSQLRPSTAHRTRG